jgi:hypothetical protein
MILDALHEVAKYRVQDHVLSRTCKIAIDTMILRGTRTTTCCMDKVTMDGR